MSIANSLRFEVFKRDSFKCQYCGRSAPEIVLEADHIHPESKGGATSLLNLITACYDCNRGKRDKLLSDNSAVTKQKNQLDDLQERREQIKMMVEWQKGLAEIDNEILEAACDLWTATTGGQFTISPSGQILFRKLISKFGFAELCAAISIAIKTYGPRVGVGKLEAICVTRSRGIEYDKGVSALYYVRGILRNRFPNNFNPKNCIVSISKAVKYGIPIDFIREVATTCEDYSEFIYELNYYNGPFNTETKGDLE